MHLNTGRDEMIEIKMFGHKYREDLFAKNAQKSIFKPSRDSEDSHKVLTRAREGGEKE